ncbi:MAG TPA: phosphate ABC transporter ATP-binding protein [Candidatus Dormibacteraeota bacterium]|jgi:phosphate transport system ATP-binding protein|nr:phosphate ABC transporter ATP-binding protein [Candidatus Dormibacteraeota bacterium]
MTTEPADGVLVPRVVADTPMMSVEQLRVAAGRTEILHGVDAAFPESRATAIIGPTGCGKTTLLRCLNRMHDGSREIRVQGRVTLEGVDIYKEFRGVRELRRRVGMLFQRPNPFPQSIIENLSVGPRLHGLVRRRDLKERAEHHLREVGLWDAVKDRLGGSPFSLSGGQQQLLCLARALSVEPSVILLDEPTSSLDPKTTEQIEELLRDIRKRITVIMVSHNLGQVRRVSDSVLFLLAGERVEFADTQTFFESPDDERSRAYIGAEVGAA